MEVTFGGGCAYPIFFFAAGVGLGSHVWRRFALGASFWRYPESQKLLGFLRFLTLAGGISSDFPDHYLLKRERRRIAIRRISDPPRDIGHHTLAAAASRPIDGSSLGLVLDFTWVVASPYSFCASR